VALLAVVGPQKLVGQEEARCDGSLIIGRVTDASGSVRLPGAIISVRWTDAVRRLTTVTTGGDGGFRVCAPKERDAAIVWAQFGQHSSRQEVVLLSAASPAELILRVELESQAAARIVGRVYDVETDAPIVAAVIELAGGTSIATTDSRGSFIVTGVSPGPNVLYVRHLGHADLEREIDAPSGATLEVEVGMSARPIEVEPLVVTVVRLRRLEIKGFYERKYWGELLGIGGFYTQDEIERRRPLRISHMVADFPGIRLRCSGSGIHGCSLENTRAGCDRVNIFLDGINLRGGSIDEYVLPVAVGGIEVYAGAAQLPAEFGGANARCGAIVIWTK